MGLIKNTLNADAGFNVKAKAPLDSRERVEYEDDLITGTTWTNETPLYKNMKVTVMETGDVWELLDETKYTDKTSGDGWVVIASPNGVNNITGDDVES